MKTNHETLHSSNYHVQNDRDLLAQLRHHRKEHRQSSSLPHHPTTHGGYTFGQRVADKVASTVGSWAFILIQSILIIIWMISNLLMNTSAWDPYPFILLNLILSFQAAYTAPAIMMSQNRQAEVDRSRANSDYEINVKAELEIELLHEKIDLIREQEIRDLSAAVKALSDQLKNQK